MVVGVRNLRRRASGPAVLVFTGALLAACAGQNGGHSGTASGSSSSSSATASSSAGARTSPLSKGLLPASAFPQATVVSMTLQQFKQATAGQLGQNGVQVNPPQCADALKTTQPDVEQVKDLVAQSATQQGSITVEAIMTGDSANGAVDKLRTAMSSCPRIDITAPQLGAATLTFTPLDVSGVSDQAAAAQYTLTITPPGRAPVTVPALIAAAQDHDRLVLLMTANAPGAGGAPAPAAPDTGAFTTLFGKAYDTEKKALD